MIYSPLRRAPFQARRRAAIRSSLHALLSFGPSQGAPKKDRGRPYLLPEYRTCRCLTFVVAPMKGHTTFRHSRAAIDQPTPSYDISAVPPLRRSQAQCQRARIVPKRKRSQRCGSVWSITTNDPAGSASGAVRSLQPWADVAYSPRFADEAIQGYREETLPAYSSWLFEVSARYQNGTESRRSHFGPY